MCLAENQRIGVWLGNTQYMQCPDKLWKSSRQLAENVWFDTGNGRVDLYHILLAAYMICGKAEDVQQFTVSFTGCTEKSESDPYICSEQYAGDAGQKDVLVHITAEVLGCPDSCFLSEEHGRMLDKQVPV